MVARGRSESNLGVNAYILYNPIHTIYNPIYYTCVYIYIYIHFLGCQKNR